MGVRVGLLILPKKKVKKNQNVGTWEKYLKGFRHDQAAWRHLKLKLYGLPTG